MGDQLPAPRAATIQAAPVYNNREATVAKTCQLIAEAARGGASLIVFPETWLPGYPFWASTDAMAGRWYVTYRQLSQNAVEVPSETTRQIGAAARAAHAYVIVGMNERDPYTAGTLYNSLLHIGPDGDVVGVHRKLMPTHHERLVHGLGDGSTLEVFQTPLGRIGGLICWEHHMPLARFALATQGEQIHASVWPAWTFQRDQIDAATRSYAIDTASYVVVSCGLLRESDVPEDVPLRQAISYEQTAGGGTGIIDPFGRYVAGPMKSGEEGILYADLDLGRCLMAKAALDIAGHYARPDVFTFAVNRTPRRAAIDSASGLPLKARDVAEVATEQGVAERAPNHHKSQY